LGRVVNRAADGTARALNFLTGKRWRLPGFILVLLGFALPVMWLAATGYFILMLVLKQEGLGPWKE
jgi:hypothetical protein